MAGFVRDLKNGEWIRAERAFFVRDEKRWETPMAWGIAAFREREEAEGYGHTMTLEEALGAVR